MRVFRIVNRASKRMHLLARLNSEVRLQRRMVGSVVFKEGEEEEEQQQQQQTHAGTAGIA